MRVLVVINPSAGMGMSAVFDFVRRVASAGHEVVIRYLVDDRTLTQLFEDVAQFDRAVVSGGDGTASGACYELRDKQVPLLVFPSGTANLLASNLNLPMEASALAKLALSGPSALFDVGELEASAPDERRLYSGFALMAGAGYDAQIMRGAAPMKSTLGAAAYLVAALASPAPSISQLVLELDDRTVVTEGFAVLVTNFGRIQFDLPITPGADPADGLLEIAVASGRSAAGLIPAVAAAVLDRAGEFRDRGPGVSVYSARSVTVTADPPLPVQWDGEVAEAHTPLTVRVLPSAVRLIVPVGSPFLQKERG
ncbi:MAG TPA: diacylglycerol kinase family protein [Coriobacteriia bacterium]|nr:diacylglycerol kinase family protein [Coriobacteriia bacterium]